MIGANYETRRTFKFVDKPLPGNGKQYRRVGKVFIYFLILLSKMYEKLSNSSLS